MTAHMKHLVLTGSESVGKTTLATLLAARYGVRMVPEFVREYAEAKGAPLDFRDHGPIAKGQMAREDQIAAEALARGDTWMVHDTDLLSTVVYCHHYFGRCPEFIEQAAVARRPDAYLLLDVDVPWVADGVRDRADRRDEVQQLFVDTLERLQAPYTIIRGDWDTRMTQAAAVIDAVFAQTSPFPTHTTS